MTKGPCHGNPSLCMGYKIATSDPSWYSLISLAEVAALISANPDAKFRFIAGDTGRGQDSLL